MDWIAFQPSVVHPLGTKEGIGKDIAKIIICCHTYGNTAILPVRVAILDN